MNAVNKPFWQRKSLEQLSQQEWESLCDGCGRCCLNKLEDEDSGEIFYTKVACRMFDLNACRCKRYDDRTIEVHDCLSLRENLPQAMAWLPASCAYRLLAEGKDLPEWHPLVSGDPETVHTAKISVRDFVIAEKPGMDLEDHLIQPFHIESEEFKP